MSDARAPRILGNSLREKNTTEGLFGKWRIQMDGRVLKGILENFDLQWKFLHPNALHSRSFH
jgi:hypothetical protein